MSDIHKNLRDTIRENLIQQNYPIAEKNLSILVRQADAHLQLTLLRREIGEKPDILNRLDQLEKKIIPPGTLEQKYEILAKKIIPNNIPLVSDHKNIAL